MPHEPSPPFDRTWVVVPIRGLETAKTRLGEQLDPEERRQLVAELLRRTLEATRSAGRVRGTVVVTMDPAAAAMARDHGAIGLVERVPGLNQAIVAGRSLTVARGATAALVLPADLPGVSAAAVDALITAAADVPLAGGPARAVVALVPDRHGSGTNALLVAPPDAVGPAFGPGSRVAHRRAAEAAGAAYVELGGPLAFDVDTPADLALAGGGLSRGRG